MQKLGRFFRFAGIALTALIGAAYVVLRSARSWRVLGLALAIAAVFVLTLVSPAMAGKVHAETSVWRYGIRRDHCDKTSGDANRDYVICYSSYVSAWAYAKEGWLYTGGQYILDNYVNSYKPSNKGYSTYTHAHHHSTSPDPGGGPDQPPPDVPPPGTPGTIVFSHVHYEQVKPRQITIDFVPETFLQISLADLAPGESDSTTLMQVVDGFVSQVVLSGRGGPEAPDIQVTRTGLFKSVPFRIEPFPNQIYVLRFDAPLHFTVDATLASELNLEGGDLISEPPCTQPPSGMVAWWPMDEPNGATAVNDIAGFNNQGTPKPGGSLGSPNGPNAVLGEVGGALFFGNNDLTYLEVPDHPEINFGQGDLSIDAWVKVIAPGSIYEIPIVEKMDRSSGVGKGYYFYIVTDCGGFTSLRFDIGDGTTAASYAIGCLVPNANQWNHVAVTVSRSSGVVTFYLDGVGSPLSSPSVPTGNIDNTLSLLIRATRVQSFWGPIYIDELELFNRALTTNEVAAIFNAGSAGKCKCLSSPFVSTAGTNDNCVPPFDLTSRSTCLNLLGGPWKQFDDPGVNHWVGHTFVGLPFNITRAELEIAMKPECDFLVGNDTIQLGLLGCPAPTGWAWGSGILILPEANGTWNCTLNPKTVFTLDLANLPLGSGTPNLLPKMNADGFLDFLVQDDTTVDYAVLRVWTNCVQIICPTNITAVTCSNCAVVNYSVQTYILCGDITNIVHLTCSWPSGSCFPIGTTVVTCTAYDDFGHCDTCSFTVTVLPYTGPDIHCPPDILVECGTAWSFDTPTIVTNCCTNVTISVLSTVTNGLCPQTITQTWLATDLCGNSNACSQTVTVLDTTPPVITCPINMTVNCASNWSFNPPTAVDACCGTNVTITVLSTVTNGICPQFITQTWQATDCCSNSITCSQTVTVVDTTPPILTCATNKTVECCSSTITFTFCGVVDRVDTNPIGQLPPLWNTVVVGDTWWLTYTFNPSAPDTGGVPPIIGEYPTAVSAFSVMAGLASSGPQTVGPASADLRVFSNQPPPYDQYEGFFDWMQGATPLDLFFQFDDATGTAWNTTALPRCVNLANFGLADFTISAGFGPFGSSIHGVITNVLCITNPCQPWQFDSPTAVDDCCTNVTITVLSTVTNGLCPQFITQTWQATDCCSNSATCTQTVTVVDTTPPVLTCASNFTVNCAARWAFDQPTAVDDCCGTNVTITFLGTVANGTCPQFITATWQATDCCSNSITCSQTVTVVDTTPPVLTCASNFTVNCDSDWSFHPPTAVDACCGTNVTINVLSTVTNGLCPQFITQTWQATDCCSNSITCSQTVTVVDTTPPVIHCPSNIVVISCNNVVVNYTATATDACCSNVTVVCTPASGSVFAPGTTTTVHCVATDCCSNTASCDFTVTVTQATLPLCRDFNDNNLHGWQLDPAAPNVVVSVLPGGQGGPNDYYVQVSDLSGASAVMAGSEFNGDWSCLTNKCGQFCYDLRIISDGCPCLGDSRCDNAVNGHQNIVPSFTLTGCGGKSFTFVWTAFVVTEDGGINPGWHRIYAPVGPVLNSGLPTSPSGHWVAGSGTSPTAADFCCVLADVEKISISPDYSSCQTEVICIDNVCWTANPECVDPRCQDFNNASLNGWQADHPAAPNVVVTLAQPGPSNLPNDYYVQVSDQAGASAVMAGSEFYGDWGCFTNCCGEFCYDYRVFSDGCPCPGDPRCTNLVGGAQQIVPRFQLVGSNGKKFNFTWTYYTVTDNGGPNPGWHRITAPLGPFAAGSLPFSPYGVWTPVAPATASDWDSVLQPVSKITFSPDFSSCQTEVIGIDNVCLRSLPSGY